MLFAQTDATPAATTLRGAGATFPYPIYAKWFENYRRKHPELEITYEAVGSEAGLRKLLSGEVDFGASDNPELLRQIAGVDEGKYLLLPSVVGAVVPIVNLPGLASDVKFTQQALAGIYLGQIKKWNDPLLQSANRGLRLPDLDIVVVHRADGSGTSYAWSDFLVKTSAEWKAQVGAGLSPHWPVGREAKGNDGVAKLVKEFGGAIGYVEFIYALQNHLSFGQVRNQAGRFVAADLESIRAAADGAGMSSDLKVSLVNAAGREAYPIACLTWFVAPAHVEESGKRQALKELLTWILGPGQKQAAALGYVALPAAVVTAEQAALNKIN